MKALTAGRASICARHPRTRSTGETLPRSTSGATSVMVLRSGALLTAVVRRGQLGRRLLESRQLVIGVADDGNRTREPFEQRPQLRETAAVGIFDCRREPGVESRHQNPTVARMLRGTLRNRCSIGSVRRFQPNFNETSRPIGPVCMPPPLSAK